MVGLPRTSGAVTPLGHRGFPGSVFGAFGLLLTLFLSLLLALVLAIVLAIVPSSLAAAPPATSSALAR